MREKGIWARKMVVVDATPALVKSSPYEKQLLGRPLSQHPSGEEVLCLQG